MKLKGNLIALVASIAHIGLTTFHPAIVLAEPPQGQLIFETRCVGCHENGGNVLSPAKTLQLGALERNGYSSIDSIIELTRNGKGQMPKYQGKIPAVSRLSDEELEAVAAFTLSQANAGWPST